MIRPISLIVLLLAPGFAAQKAGDWAQFRGPGGLSLADETPIPKAFGPGQNVL